MFVIRIYSYSIGCFRLQRWLIALEGRFYFALIEFAHIELVHTRICAHLRTLSMCAYLLCNMYMYVRTVYDSVVTEYSKKYSVNIFRSNLKSIQ